MIVRVADDKGRECTRGTLAGQVEQELECPPKWEDENWKTALSTHSGSSSSSSLSPSHRDTFVSGQRPPTINFTYLPLSRLSSVLKLKISPIMIASHSRYGRLFLLNTYRKKYLILNRCIRSITISNISRRDLWPAIIIQSPHGDGSVRGSNWGWSWDAHVIPCTDLESRSDIHDVMFGTVAQSVEQGWI